MGDGTKEKPYTRKDVMRRIKANGGTAEGLNLSGKVFEDGIDLRDLDLTGVILKGAIFWDITRENIDEDDPTSVLEGAHLEGTALMNAHLEGAHILGSHLEQADLFNAHLEGTLLTEAHLEEANLTIAHLEGAKMRSAHLERVFWAGAKLSSETILDNVNWGNYILWEEIIGLFDIAGETYRQLKMWHSNAGMYEVAGEFFYREMEVKRKAFWWGDFKEFSLKDSLRPFKFKQLVGAIFPQKPFHWSWSQLISLISGYGERPLRVIGWAASVIFGLALIYFLIGSVWEWSAFWSSLYYSAVSFTALGYGSWAPQPTGWVKGLGAVEAFLGVFMMALFLVTFIRKMTR